MATICQKHGPSPRRSARGPRAADSGRFGFKSGGLTRYPRDPRSRYAVFGPLKTCDIVDPGPENVIPLQLSGGFNCAIGPPAAAAAAVIWRSNTVPVDLGRALRSDIFRQLASDRGGSVQINGSLVHLVVDRWVSGHRINEKDPICAGLGSRSGRFKQWGGVRGSHVSLKEKARTGRA